MPFPLHNLTEFPIYIFRWALSELLTKHYEMIEIISL